MTWCPPCAAERGAWWATATGLCLLLALTACRSPRDPDLDERLAKAAAPARPSDGDVAATAEAVTAPRGTREAPPRGEVVLRTYDPEDLASIMAAIPGSGPTVRMDVNTQAGSIHCTLDVDAAPQTVGNLVALALGLRPWRDPDTGEEMETRFYDGLSFHRCITGFIIQTGNPSTVRAGGPGWTLAREAGNAVRLEEPGALAMVDAGDDTHGSQFFITLRPALNLKDRYLAFGHCENLDRVRAIANGDKLPPTKEGKSATRPRDPVRIDTITITREALPPTP